MPVLKILKSGEQLRFEALCDENGVPYDASNPIPVALDASSITVTVITSAPGTITGGTVGTSDGSLIGTDATRSVILIQNVHATATIACRSGSAAALNVGGNWMAGPNGFIVFEGAAAQAAIHAISDTASTPVTVGVG